MADLPDLTLSPSLLASDLVERVNATETRVAALESDSGTSGLEPRVTTLEEDVASIVTVSPSKNLYNPADPDAATGYLMSGATGQPTASEFYSVTGFIPVTAGQQYTLSNPRNITFHDTTKGYLTGPEQYVNHSAQTPLTITVPAGAAYLRASFNTANYAATFQVEKGTQATAYEPYGDTLTLAAPLKAELLDDVDTQVDARLDALQVTPSQTTFAVQSKNLYNEADPDVVRDFYLNDTDGTLIALAGYVTSGWIPVKAGQAYTINVVRKAVFYNTTKGYVTGHSPSQGSPQTYTAPVDGFLRFSYTAAGPNGHLPKQVEAGTVATAFEPFGLRIPSLLVDDTTGGMSIGWAGGELTMQEAVGDEVLVAKMRPLGGNNVMNFSTVTYGGTVISTNTDDVAPIRTQMGTIGANHGYPNVRSFTNPDGKDTTDLGSVWTDGSREYVLLAFASGRPVLGGDWATNGNGATTSPVVAPTAALTHVSGATHTGTIDHTTAASAQLYPTVGRLDASVWVAGRRLVDGEALSAPGVVVREAYDIFDYGSIYDTAKANPGVEWWTLPTLATAVSVANVYTFTGNGRCDIETEVVEVAPTDLAACGFIQAGVMNPSGASVLRQVPGLAPKGGHDFTAGVVMSSFTTSQTYTSSDLTHAARPPVFALDRAQVGGDTLVGMVLGYRPDAGADTDSTTRLANAATNLWDMRSTAKIYPNAIVSENAGWSRVTASGYRLYLDPATADTLASRATAGAATAWSSLRALVGL